MQSEASSVIRKGEAGYEKEGRSQTEITYTRIVVIHSGGEGEIRGQIGAKNRSRYSERKVPDTYLPTKVFFGTREARRGGCCWLRGCGVAGPGGPGARGPGAPGQPGARQVSSSRRPPPEHKRREARENPSTRYLSRPSSRTPSRGNAVSLTDRAALSCASSAVSVAAPRLHVNPACEKDIRGQYRIFASPHGKTVYRVAKARKSGSIRARPDERKSRPLSATGGGERVRRSESR